LVFNGEIYNHVELRRELSCKGHVFHSTSDTEVLLCAYAQWGEDCLERLNGMFAFAIWDEGRRRLFAARDRFGEKPFYYVWNEHLQRFAFASEIKSLIRLGVCEPEIDDSALAAYVDFEELDGSESTLIAGVRRLAAASSLLLDWPSGATPKVKRYWSLPVERVDMDLATAAQRYAELFEDSVRIRLRADVPVGSSLSGGLDSTAVVCQIHQLGAAAGQNTFSARMDEARLDEGRYIDLVLARVAVGAHSVTPQAEAFRKEFDQMCWFMEEPFPATSMYAQFRVMALAAEHQTTVILDGQGADEMLGGYGHYVRHRQEDLLVRGRLSELRLERRAYANLRGGTQLTSLRRLAFELLPDGIMERLQRRNQSKRFADWWNPCWLGLQPAKEPVSQHRPGHSRLDAALRWDSTEGPLQALLRYGDRNSMAWSRELRQPFLDHRLAELVFSLPDQFKVGAGMTKRVLREAMRDIIPEQIANRHDKLGYQAPLGSWFSGSLREWVSGGLEQARDMLDQRMATDVIDRFRAIDTVDDWADGRALVRILSLVSGLRALQQCKPVSRQVEMVDVG
ncbi:MAG: asparagine synthase (glutamine-hydrolyzing), partial [Xanthomonadales bacterium]|nr:asparagine synthase (glutamine-hydrolyzing) [Xanthomonadales bacterium]